jgi:SAM-dependent methyltransferase/dienelactone hydrolase
MFVLICSRYGVEAVVQVNARRMAGEVLTEKQKEIAALLADENRGRGRLIWLKNYFVGEVITAIVTVREKHQLAVVNKDIQQLPAVKHHSRAFFVVVGSLVGLKKGALFLIKLVSKAIRSIAGFFSSDKTELIEFFNRRGQIIKAYLDYPQGNKPMGKNIWVVIPPAFGKTKETSFLLALFLRANGIGVVRFDDSDSNGESAGRIYDLTLSNSTNNILDAVQYLQMRFNPSNIGVIPFSLSARTAMKAVAQDPRGSFLLPIVGAPNLESLLEGVYGENLVAEYREGRREGPINMLGHIINSGNFLGDAAKNGFADLASAQADMARISCPVVWFCGEQDPWVKPEEVIEVLGNKPDRRVVTFAGLQHRVREAGRAPELFAEVVRNVISITTGIDSDKVVLREPSASEIVERATTEKGRLEVRLTKEETIRQWDEYLKGFGVLLQTTDYMDYLDLLCEQIDFTPGERLIDIGGGHGNLTTLLLNRLSFDVEVRGWQKSEVTGVDFVETAVTKAREGVREALNRRQDLPSINFQRVDMETDPLPHESNYYDTAVASLFLSYVHNPAEVVRKICRSVKPGGIIILTSLKPDADVSQIFHRFLEKVRAMEPSPERERLLSQGRELFNSAMGWIENEEERGQFKYFSAGELKNLLKANDCEIEEITYSFGEQAVVVVGRMRK